MEMEWQVLWCVYSFIHFNLIFLQTWMIFFLGGWNSKRVIFNSWWNERWPRLSSFNKQTKKKYYKSIIKEAHMTYALSVLNSCNSFVQWTDWNLRPCSLIILCWAVNLCKMSHLDELKNWVNLIHERIVHTCFVNLFRERIVNLLVIASYMNFHGLEKLTFFFIFG